MSQTLSVTTFIAMATKLSRFIQVIVIQWQLSVTPKKLPDRGVFPFKNGVKKKIFPL